MQSSCLSKRHLFRASHFRARYGINLGRSQGARCVCCLLCQFALADSTDWPYMCVCLILWPMSFWPLASIPYPYRSSLLPTARCVLRAACCFSCGFCFYNCSCLTVENICIRARTVGVLATQCPCSLSLSLLPYLFTHHLSVECHVLCQTRTRTQPKLTCSRIFPFGSVIVGSSGEFL